MPKIANIIYTHTDEAPALATYSLLPIIKRFTSLAEISVELKDISLSNRILAAFTDRSEDALKQLGELIKGPDANIIKLPNISASVPQLKGAINELQKAGFDVPNYPEGDGNELIKKQYGNILGSAVNPVLRDGNSDRRVAAPVKEYAKNNPHSMDKWRKDSRTHVASMNKGDFYASEQSARIQKAGSYEIKFINNKKKINVLKKASPMAPGDLIDSAVMSCKHLCKFFEREIKDAKDNSILLSLHLKATMMKISDPIIFGHGVKAYFESVIDKHAEVFSKIEFNPNNGISDLMRKISSLPDKQREEIESDIKKCYEDGPKLAMVDSEHGITNLHVPSDIIIDASMPACIRAGGRMWGPDGFLHDTKALIPDRCYAGIYQEVINFCKEHGAFDPKTMGSVSNIGLMAKKAQEYGSHDKTFEISQDGIIRVVNDQNQVLMEHKIKKGDIFRMCHTKEEAIKDWIKLGLNKAQKAATRQFSG